MARNFARLVLKLAVLSAVGSAALAQAPKSANVTMAPNSEQQGSVTIRNGCKGDITFGIKTNADWLQVTTPQVPVASGGSGGVRFNVSSIGLGPGTYNGELTVYCAGGACKDQNGTSCIETGQNTFPVTMTVVAENKQGGGGGGGSPAGGKPGAGGKASTPASQPTSPNGDAQNGNGGTGTGATSPVSTTGGDNGTGTGTGTGGGTGTTTSNDIPTSQDGGGGGDLPWGAVTFGAGLVGAGAGLMTGSGTPPAAKPQVGTTEKPKTQSAGDWSATVSGPAQDTANPTGTTPTTQSTTTTTPTQPTGDGTGTTQGTTPKTGGSWGATAQTGTQERQPQGTTPGTQTTDGGGGTTPTKTKDGGSWGATAQTGTQERQPQGTTPGAQTTDGGGGTTPTKTKDGGSWGATAQMGTQERQPQGTTPGSQTTDGGGGTTPTQTKDGGSWGASAQMGGSTQDKQAGQGPSDAGGGGVPPTQSRDKDGGAWGASIDTGKAPEHKPGDLNEGGGHTFSRGTTKADLEQANKPPTAEELAAAKPGGGGSDDYATREKKIREQMANRRIAEEAPPPIRVRTGRTQQRVPWNGKYDPTGEGKWIKGVREDKVNLEKENDSSKKDYLMRRNWQIEIYEDAYAHARRDLGMDNLTAHAYAQIKLQDWLDKSLEDFEQTFATHFAQLGQALAADPFHGLNSAIEELGQLGEEAAAGMRRAGSVTEGAAGRAAEEEESVTPDWFDKEMEEHPENFEADESEPILTHPETGEPVPAEVDPATGALRPKDPAAMGTGTQAKPGGRIADPEAPTMGDPKLDPNKTQPDLLPGDKMPAKGMQKTGYDNFNKIPVDPNEAPGTRLPYSKGRQALNDPLDPAIDPATGKPVLERTEIMPPPKKN
ncbi:MAG: hypothetical protein JO041_07085 [Acidobacteria bacterium]|nr:hypothetical protein [Acidobacteriota bacterium]